MYKWKARYEWSIYSIRAAFLTFAALFWGNVGLEHLYSLYHKFLELSSNYAVGLLGASRIFGGPTSWKPSRRNSMQMLLVILVIGVVAWMVSLYAFQVMKPLEFVSIYIYTLKSTQLQSWNFLVLLNTELKVRSRKKKEVSHDHTLDPLPMQRISFMVCQMWVVSTPECG